MARKSLGRLDHFEFLAPVYERIIRPADLTRLRRLAALDSRDVLLEVGGGTGRVSGRFVGAAHAVVVLDASFGMLRQAKTKLGALLCQGISERLPFRNETFTKVVAVDSFHHFQDRRQAAAEMLRVLVPGGRLIIEEPDISLWQVKLVALAETLTLMRSHFWRLEEIVALFESHGARVWFEREPPNFWVVAIKAVT